MRLIVFFLLPYSLENNVSFGCKSDIGTRGVMLADFGSLEMKVARLMRSRSKIAVSHSSHCPAGNRSRIRRSK